MDLRMEENQRKKTIIEFITNNPDCSKERVSRYMDGLGAASRTTTMKDLSELEDEEIIYAHRQKQNSRDVKLRINAGNIVVLVTSELEQFERTFVTLLNKVRTEFDNTYSDIKKIHPNNLSKKDLSKVNPILESMTESLRIFYEVVDSYMVRSLMLWSNKVQDKDVLKKLYSIVFTKISDIQLHIYQVFGSTLAGSFNPPLLQSAWRKIYSTEHMKEHYESFTRLNMKNEISSVLDCVWKMNSECKLAAYPEPILYKWNFNYDNDDWRKLLILQKKHPRQTYRSSIEEFLKLTNLPSNS
jgi:SepF-like predicted cell division protein (DUF552 family)